jgi:hypothetical protein
MRKRAARSRDVKAAVRTLEPVDPRALTEFGDREYPNTISGVSVALRPDYRSIAEYLAYARQPARGLLLAVPAH